MGTTIGETAQAAEAIVVGGGPAGLAAAAELGRRGVPTLVLEGSGHVGGSWRGRYDRLRLNTSRRMSGLPGYGIDPDCGRWVGRDDFVAYLEAYARRHALGVLLGTEATRIEREGGLSSWRVETPRGPLRARFVVVATGFDRVPVLPEWPGREGFAGRLVHASSYRNPAPYRGKDVLVVGLGSTGNELAVDLLEGGARSVRVAVRTPPNVFPREWLGVPTSLVARAGKRLPAAVADRAGWVLQRLAFGDLSSYGLPRAPHGVATTLRLRGHGIAVDSGFVDALKRGSVEVVAAVERFEGPEVVLADGVRLRPDAVIAATGYRPGLEPLVGHLPGVLGPDGRPEPLERMPAGSEGLGFVGYEIPVSGQLPEMAATARRVARAFAEQRRFAGAGAATESRQGRPRGTQLTSPARPTARSGRTPGPASGRVDERGGVGVRREEREGLTTLARETEERVRPCP